MSSPSLRFVTPKEMQLEHLPWCRNEWLCRPGLVDAEQLLVVRAIMAAGQAHLFHRHPTREEVIYVLEGRAEQWVEDGHKILQPGDMAHIPTNAVHATFNPYEEPLIFLAILAPAQAEGPDLVDMSEEDPWRTMRPWPGPQEIR